MPKPFGSTLSAGGLLALRGAGFRPLTQVQGMSVYRIGWQRLPNVLQRRSLEAQRLDAGYLPNPAVYTPRGALTAAAFRNEGMSTELEKPTEAYNEARRLALSRLRDAAREAGATAVVDLRVERGRFDPIRRAVHFSALGTAITSDHIELDDYEEIPLTTLSGADFWKLVRSGYWPLGLVGGTSVVYVISGYRTKRARSWLSPQWRRNVEYEDYTQGLLEGRRLAMGRLRHEAREVGAAGILAVELAHERRKRGFLSDWRKDDIVLTVDALGTAIAPMEHEAPPPDPYYGLDLGAR
jgi:uncharacterized protein YbjQ (UPF0145 family)